MVELVLKRFGFSETDYHYSSFGNGLINSTWLIEKNGSSEKYILQKINHTVFKNPEDIDHNIRLIHEYFQHHHPDYLFAGPLKTIDGTTMVNHGEQFFRLFPFISGSHTIDIVENPDQAYEAARQFGKFTRLLSGLDAGQLKITLPNFHDLSMRYRQFETALSTGNSARIKQSRGLINFIHEHRNIAGEFEFNKPDLETRCTHHDTKISNILFDESDKGLCVIDLDTVMPGHFISDVGDMMRTYLSPVNEEERNFSAIEIRPAFYSAIVEGYMAEMAEELNDFEKMNFLFAGKFMIYMQAIRFLTDHISNDVYYGSRYEGHNFVRAGNQVVLLQRLIEFNPR
jgi:Ser/Thr protein kinase RdoA (MazF antagonist)